MALTQSGIAKADSTIEVLPVQIDGDGAPLMSSVLTDHIRTSLLGFRTSEPSTIQCQIKAQGAFYSIRMVRSAANSSKRYEVEGECPICTVEELTNRLTVLAREVAKKETVPGPLLVSNGTPAPANRNWKWLTASTAVASLATGFTLMSMHGDGACIRTNTICPRIRNTRTAGTALLLVGAGFAVTSGWLFYRDSTREVRGTVTPMPDGFAAAVSGHF